ncbi:MAG: prephenate dehydratase [Thermoanaerobaculales bacterium]|nr:prephenate dehydratase [Thermoanaerobaculales bacterium]
MKDLRRLRLILDGVDRQIIEKLQERQETVAEIAGIKRKGLNFLRDHERESALLDRIEAWAREFDLDPFRTREIFREVIAMSLKAQEEALLGRERAERNLQFSHRVAYQGTNGPYSQLAAKKYFANRAEQMEFIGHSSFAEALGSTEAGETGYAMLPIENTTAGSINQTYELLRKTDLRIVGEEILHIRHCLAALEGATRQSIRRILSHPQALTQCSLFLASQKDLEVISFRDTAAAAREVRDAGDPSQAAIASEDAAEIYGLSVIVRDIADQNENWTRFVIVSAADMTPDPRIPSKISLVYTTPHREGALADSLRLLSEYGLNLCKLESRPMPNRPWEYLFYVDVEGSLATEPAALAIAELRRECPYLKVLGSYPARTTPAGIVDRVES